VIKRKLGAWALVSRGRFLKVRHRVSAAVAVGAWFQ
jgi:hypothetical protein